MYRIKKILKYLLLKLKLKKVNGVKVKSINVSNDIQVEEFVQIAKKVNISSNVKIGKATYISPNTTIDSNVIIGKYCSMGPGVFIAPGEHYPNFITTHPVLFDPIWRKILKISEKEEYLKQIGAMEQTTIIGNDVWIGINSIIMRGVKIGDGAIIGAGAVVTKDVEPYSIVAGVPAKVIRYRFKRSDIEKLANSEKWWDLSENEIAERLEHMYNIENYIKTYK